VKKPKLKDWPRKRTAAQKAATIKKREAARKRAAERLEARNNEG
tara:strand:+ start:145 stop:276 length:132 start_codon:yes stop_codon:yes gene_type:complete